jgi:transcription-repair coupling factor (superfamily II helicase)
MQQPSAPWGSLLRAPFFSELERRIAAGERGTCLSGLVAASRSLVLTMLAQRARRPLLVVLPDDTAVESYRRDLSAFAALSGRDAVRIVALPALDADPYAGIPPHPEVLRERVVGLAALRRGAVDVLLVPVRALLQPLPSPEELSHWTRVIRAESNLAPDRFVLEVLRLGYRRVDIVSAPGEVSRRGGIVDIFPPGSNQPVRIELFGDTVESLRAFDTDNQRSIAPLGQVEIGPASENPPTEEALERLSRYLDDRVARVGDDEADREQQLRALRAMLEQLQERGYWPGLEGLARLSAERPVSLFEHGAGCLLCVDEAERTDEALVRAHHELRLSHDQAERRVLPPPDRLFLDPLDVRGRLERADLLLQELIGEEPAHAAAVLQVNSRSARSYAGRIQHAVEDLAGAVRHGERVLCVMRAPGGAQRLQELFAEYELPAARETAPDAAVRIGVAGLRHGFELPDQGFALLTERDLFGEERKTSERKPSSRAAFISDFRDLKKGDHVVHTDHGIARFAGLGRPKGGSLNRDFMLLEFAGRDRLFVPVDRLDLVQKYGGVAGRKPVLDKLGGPSWDRVKRKVRKAVESMAKELLELYARRKTAEGYRFSPDTPWQAELEQAFPYELTPDQARALAEIKSDMESGRPTDRLLVGDVGYGKTEVAVRAAFKAVMDGFQVALLAPTTVLATQHFKTFRERYGPFPVRVDLVSRFRSAAETRRVLRDLEAGSIDVLIGTHRLLSKDVAFKKLGLLVVDEEQRFGVAHKERLKKLATGIDVISMTATPIPRTLQMSLAGVRDLSIIETPPPGRMAIQTYIVPFRKNVLAQAIRTELRRGGQVFVVHNRVETLPALARAVTEMVPEARVTAAHGQMADRVLERVMLQFVEHEADVLVTTTIIENGLDIPRANTIIVNRADRFGLAQLYQLRGRVGRSQEHAYAFFVVPGRQNLGEDARKRLRALQEFSDLGAGFRLAAADLEIRGAGELLGARQHGHIAALGFDLYCQMLENTVRELQGEEVVERKPVNLHLGVDIKIPESYLGDSADRLVIYKRLAQAATEEDVDRLQSETEDRFGHLPNPARNLFDMGRLRLAAERAGVRSVDLIEQKLQIRFHDLPPVEPDQVLALAQMEGGSLKPSGMLELPAAGKGGDRIAAVDALVRRLLG